jgi:hypothetical protein
VLLKIIHYPDFVGQSRMCKEQYGVVQGRISCGVSRPGNQKSPRFLRQKGTAPCTSIPGHRVKEHLDPICSNSEALSVIGRQLAITIIHLNHDEQINYPPAHPARAPNSAHTLTAKLYCTANAPPLPHSTFLYHPQYHLALILGHSRAKAIPQEHSSCQTTPQRMESCYVFHLDLPVDRQHEYTDDCTQE